MALFCKDFDPNAPPFHLTTFRWKTDSSLPWRTYCSMSWIFILLLLIYPSFPYSPTSCLSIQASCVQRRGCSSALHHYLLSCAYLISGQTTTEKCSVRCQRALVTLVSATTEEPSSTQQYLHHGWSSSSSPPTQPHHGWPLPSFMSCTCGENVVCQSHRARLDSCLEGVRRAMRAVDDEEESVPCTLAEQICRADTSCLTAIEFYGRNCGYLLHASAGDRCLSRCRNSVRVLYRQRQATKLRSCHCDGTEDYDCRMLQNRTQELCVEGEQRVSTKALQPRQRSIHHPNITSLHQTLRSVTPPPPEFHGSVNSGSRPVIRRKQNEALICLNVLLPHVVCLAVFRSG